MIRPAKVELLEHYATREPKRFIQYDAHDLRGGGADDVMRPDEDGMCLMRGGSWELMHGCAVRVLIEPGTTKERAALSLRKIAEWIESPGLLDLEDNGPGHTITVRERILN
jgi:hypothetical protein